MTEDEVEWWDYESAKDMAEAVSGGGRSVPNIVAHVRGRLARQISDANTGPGGYIPLIALSPEWEAHFADSLVGQGDDRQLAMAPTRLGEFMHRMRAAFEGAASESPVLLCSGAARPHVRAIVERLRPSTPVLAQVEIHPRARIKTVGTI